MRLDNKSVWLPVVPETERETAALGFTAPPLSLFMCSTIFVLLPVPLSSPLPLSLSLFLSAIDYKLKNNEACVSGGGQESCVSQVFI